jgi:selenocysteine lyase/cysteine desulfurase
MYDIAIRSEKMYVDSKKKVCEVLNGNSWREVIYSFNSTYASNLLVSSIKKSNILKKGDTVLVSIVEHHANVVPWLILKDEIGIHVEYVRVDENFAIDLDDFRKKYTNDVKIISLTHVSNVVGEINNLEQIGKEKREDTLFIIDASQSVPHMKVDVQKLNCDALFFTGHKMMADSGIGILWGKEGLLKSLTPSFSGG